MNPVLLTAALLGGMLVLAGCDDGKSVSTPTAAEDIDPCALLTEAEIEEATGIAPGAPDDDGAPMCEWPAADDAYPFAVSVLVGPSYNYSSLDDVLADLRESAQGMGFDFDPSDYEAVEGPGTVNVWDRDMEMLQAHRGNRMVQAYVRVAPGRDRLEASIALSRHAMARLD
jgi:hypothetical protein